MPKITFSLFQPPKKNAQKKGKKQLAKAKTPTIEIMHQSFEPPSPGHGGDIHSVWVWKPVKFLDTGGKYWVKSPPLGTQMYKPKSAV